MFENIKSYFIALSWLRKECIWGSSRENCSVTTTTRPWRAITQVQSGKGNGVTLEFTEKLVFSAVTDEATVAFWTISARRGSAENSFSGPGQKFGGNQEGTRHHIRLWEPRGKAGSGSLECSSYRVPPASCSLVCVQSPGGHKRQLPNAQGSSEQLAGHDYQIGVAAPKNPSPVHPEPAGFSGKCCTW